MKNNCKHFSAKKWFTEAPGLCCFWGKINLSTIQDPPESLKIPLSQDSPAAKHFRRNLLKYNSVFQMTSFGADTNVTNFGLLITNKNLWAELSFDGWSSSTTQRIL